MERRVSFVDDRAGVELVMPVTPSGYDWVWASDFTSVHIDQLGDVGFPAGKKPNSAKLELLLPAHRYAFMTPGAAAEPQHYLEPLLAWHKNDTVLRYIVSGTAINVPVYIQELKQEELDGTNDVIATVILREHLAPTVSKLDTVGEAVTSATTYVVRRGDTLSSIARRFYGDASLCWRLAAANGIKNANLIRVGQALQIPAYGNLPAEQERPRSAKLAGSSYVYQDRVHLRHTNAEQITLR